MTIEDRARRRKVGLEEKMIKTLAPRRVCYGRLSILFGLCWQNRSQKKNEMNRKCTVCYRSLRV